MGVTKLDEFNAAFGIDSGSTQFQGVSGTSGCTRLFDVKTNPDDPEAFKIAHQMIFEFDGAGVLTQILIVNN